MYGRGHSRIRDTSSVTQSTVSLPEVKVRTIAAGVSTVTVTTNFTQRLSPSSLFYFQCLIVLSLSRTRTYFLLVPVGKQRERKLRDFFNKRRYGNEKYGRILLGF